MTTALILTLPVAGMVILGVVAKIVIRRQVPEWELGTSVRPVAVEALAPVELEHLDPAAVSKAA